ncbi:MAG TPA: type II toxin-antitoxin system RelE/ParE family toxin [Anaerolineae bacterium]|nr:type II toxin-antitoxin system RelE/ParE family toxin [Anaerolineae bacterium]HIP71050.1 type II toxin-antitoxin system RelE/ParE family toxin [Anaerolineae bacterium]
MKKANEKWRIHIERQPQRALRRLPKTLGQRIDRAILELTNNPRPVHSRKLVGFANMYRIRVGDWRIIYTIQDKQLFILAIRIAPRGSAYRNLP